LLLLLLPLLLVLSPRGETSSEGAGSADGGGATGRAAAAVSLLPLAPPPPSAVDLAEPIGEKYSAELLLSFEGGIERKREEQRKRKKERKKGREKLRQFFFCSSLFLSLREFLSRLASSSLSFLGEKEAEGEARVGLRLEVKPRRRRGKVCE
jgi:hypothetical protein